MECQNQTLNLLQSKINLFLCMCVLFHFSFVCTSAYANVYFKTAFNQHSCVRGPLRECRSIRSGASGLSYYCAPLVCISAVIDSLAVWRHNKTKPKNQVVIGLLRVRRHNKPKTKKSLGVGRAPPGGYGSGFWSSSRLYYPFGKGPGQH